MSRFLVAVLTLLALSPACQADTPCPPDKHPAECKHPKEVIVGMTAIYGALEAACRKSDPAHAEEYSANLRELMRDQAGLVERARNDPTYPDLLKKAEDEIKNWSKEQLAQQCALLAPAPPHSAK